MNKCCRLRKSRNSWKQKAVNRANTIREMRKKVKVMQKRVIDCAAAMQDKLTSLEENNETIESSCKNNNNVNVERLQEADFVRILCVLLVIKATLPFRAVPRILFLFCSLGIFSNIWIPHFTSIINWTLRLGIAKLQDITPLLEPWVAILDCSINIGIYKALVVLRVPLLALKKKGGAVGLEDCECIGIDIEHSWTGPSVKTAIKSIFEKAGKPQAILKDKGADLKKGVVLWHQDQDGEKIWTIDDIGHEVANALKAEYAKTNNFQEFIKIIHKGAARIRQTTLAYVLPPKIRTKGRFQGITRVAKWSSEILDLIGGRGRAKADSNIGKLRSAFSGLRKLCPFLKKFISTCMVVSEFQKLLKNKGLNQATYEKAIQIIEFLPYRSKVRIRLKNWLVQALQIQCRLNIGQTPLIVSSDVIESLFGKFKVMIQRNPMAELNRLVYAIPLLCGNTSIEVLDSSLKGVSHTKLQKKLENEVPKTLRSSRREFLNRHHKGGTKNREHGED